MPNLYKREIIHDKIDGDEYFLNSFVSIKEVNEVRISSILIEVDGNCTMSYVPVSQQKSDKLQSLLRIYHWPSSAYFQPYVVLLL